MKEIICSFNLLLIVYIMGWASDVKAQDASPSLSYIEKIELYSTYRGQLDSTMYYLKLLSKSERENLAGDTLYALAARQIIDTIDLSPAFNNLEKKYYDEGNICLSLRSLLLNAQYKFRKKSSEDVTQFLKSKVDKINIKDYKKPEEIDMVTMLHILLSFNLSNNGDYLAAFEYAKKVEQLLEKTETPDVRFEAARLLKDLYQGMASDESKVVNNTERAKYLGIAKNYLNKALEYSKALNSPKIEAIAQYDLGVYYSNKGKVDSAIYFISNAVALSKKINDNRMTGITYNAVANMYIYKARTLGVGPAGQAMLDTVGVFLDSTEIYAEKSGYDNLIINTNIARANMYAGQNKFAEALPYATKGILKAEEINNFSKMRLGYHTRYVISKYSGELDSALVYYQKKIEARDSMLSAENKAKIDALTKKYENEKIIKENLQLTTKNEIQALNISRKNWMIGLIGLLAVSIPAILFLFFRKRNAEQERKAIKAEQKLLRSQLNPHFLFNALNAIQQYIYQQKDPTIVADYLAKFSRLTRKILLYSREEFIPIEDEVKFLEDYLELQQIRFDVPFSYTIELDPELMDDDVVIPPMFTQPFLENSIEHGLISKSGEGKIKVKMYKENNKLQIEIEDNGIGINQSNFEKRNKKHRSLAMEITRERLSNIDRIEKTKTNLTIQDLSDINNLITGTLARLTLPLIQN